MDRRRILLALAAAGAGLALPAARAQAPAKVPRVGLFNYGSRHNVRSRTDAFIKAMRELGYEEGRNIHYEARHANGQPDLLRDLAVELSRMNVDVIVSSATLTTEALLHATSTIPIVMATVEDPVLSGFAKSISRPETNVTGLTANAVELVSRHMELLLRVAPGLGKVGALLNPGNAIYAPYRARLEATARASRVRLVSRDATTYRDIELAFKDLASQSVGGLILMSDGHFYTERASIAELAARYRIPTVYPQQGYVDAGGLMSYGQSLEGNYVRAASYVDRILKGEKPGEMAIEQPSNHELIVNRNAARSLGIALSADLLKRANKVIG